MERGLILDPKIDGNGPKMALKRPRDSLKMGPDRPQNGGGSVRERRNGDTILGGFKRILGVKGEDDEPLTTNRSQNHLKTAPKQPQSRPEGGSKWRLCEEDGGRNFGGGFRRVLGHFRRFWEV